MNTLNIPDEFLEMELYENWDMDGSDPETVTLQMELQREFHGEDLEYAIFEYGSRPTLTAWSKTYVGTLIYGSLGDTCMIAMKRNP